MKIFGFNPRLYEEPIGDLGGGGGDNSETSLAIIPASDTSAPSTDTPAASGEPGSGEPGAVTKFRGQLFTDDAKFNPGLKSIFERLRREDPAAENKIRGGLFELKNLRAEFPGGLTEVRERMASLQQIIDDFGGEDAVSEARGELEFFHQLDQQFTAGDPRFIKAMIDAPGGQDAFLKLAPSMMAEYERIFPDGFANFVDNKLVDRMRNADFRVNLERLADFLVQLPEGQIRENAAQYWVAIRDFYNTLTASAKNKLVPPVAAAPAAQPDTRASEFEARETALKKREFSTAGAGEINGEFARQWKAIAKGTTAIQSHVRPAFDMKMQAALKADKSVDKAIQGYFSRNDVEGYRSYIRAQYQKHAARILKAELGHYRTGIVTPPTVNGAAPAAPSANGTPAPRAEAGWTMLNRRLTPDEYSKIDTDKTDRGMLYEGKAIMKDGRKVQFKR